MLREFARGNDFMKATIRKIGGIDAIVHALFWLQPLTFNKTIDRAIKLKRALIVP